MLRQLWSRSIGRSQGQKACLSSLALSQTRRKSDTQATSALSKTFDGRRPKRKIVLDISWDTWDGKSWDLEKMVPQAANTRKWIEGVLKETKDLDGRLRNISTDETAIDERLLLGSEMVWLQSRVQVSSLCHQWFGGSRFTSSAIRSILRQCPWRVLSEASSQLHDVNLKILQFQRPLAILFMISKLQNSQPLLHLLEICRYQASSQFEERLIAVGAKIQQIEVRTGSMMSTLKSSGTSSRMEWHYWSTEREKAQFIRELSRLNNLVDIATFRRLEYEAARNPQFAIYLSRVLPLSFHLFALQSLTRTILSWIRNGIRNRDKIHKVKKIIVRMFQIAEVLSDTKTEVKALQKKLGMITEVKLSRMPEADVVKELVLAKEILADLKRRQKETWKVDEATILSELGPDLAVQRNAAGKTTSGWDMKLFVAPAQSTTKKRGLKYQKMAEDGFEKTVKDAKGKKTAKEKLEEFLSREGSG
ncbi:hypothetical protein BU16DRAFT_281186 [Lophium mytilinum]|uniref:Uncharacterized protein n=1 Tax=Lophium mytilinum TaxID=390894 RepID=A0A6A6R8G5_9PEZI|nr:hypothetical protein BU16DRAFT_281186 [Lophium mytilinum]